MYMCKHMYKFIDDSRNNGQEITSPDGNGLESLYGIKGLSSHNHILWSSFWRGIHTCNIIL